MGKAWLVWVVLAPLLAILFCWCFKCVRLYIERSRRKHRPWTPPQVNDQPGIHESQILTNADRQPSVLAPFPPPPDSEPPDDRQEPSPPPLPDSEPPDDDQQPDVHDSYYAPPAYSDLTPSAPLVPLDPDVTTPSAPDEEEDTPPAYPGRLPFHSSTDHLPPPPSYEDVAHIRPMPQPSRHVSNRYTQV